MLFMLQLIVLEISQHVVYQHTDAQLSCVFSSPLQPLSQGIQLLFVRLDVTPCVWHGLNETR